MLKFVYKSFIIEHQRYLANDKRCTHLSTSSINPTWKPENYFAPFGVPHLFQSSPALRSKSEAEISTPAIQFLWWHWKNVRHCSPLTYFSFVDYQNCPVQISQDAQTGPIFTGWVETINVIIFPYFPSRLGLSLTPCLGRLCDGLDICIALTLCQLGILLSGF